MDNYKYNSEESLVPYHDNFQMDTHPEMQLTNDSFLPAYLLKNKGKWVKVEHLIGNNLVSHIGQLIKVGIDFIVLKTDSNNLSTLLCNLKDIRFMTIVYTKNNIK